jgi:predicted metal-dependent peptidase/Sec-independent protein translocase protein TatA
MMKKPLYILQFESHKWLKTWQNTQRLVESAATTQNYPELEIVKEDVERAIALLIGKFPFFGAFVYRFRILYVNAKDNRVKTMATDGKNIFINPAFAKSLTDAQTIFVLCHEILHNVMLHFTRERAKAVTKHKRWNRAADYEINPMLVDEGLLTKEELTNTLRGLFDEKYEGKTAEEIYDIIGDKKMPDLPPDLQKKIDKAKEEFPDIEPEEPEEPEEIDNDKKEKGDDKEEKSDDKEDNDKEEKGDDKKEKDKEQSGDDKEEGDDSETGEEGDDGDEGEGDGENDGDEGEGEGDGEDEGEGEGENEGGKSKGKSKGGSGKGKPSAESGEGGDGESSEDDDDGDGEEEDGIGGILDPDVSKELQKELGVPIEMPSEKEDKGLQDEAVRQQKHLKGGKGAAGSGKGLLQRAIDKWAKPQANWKNELRRIVGKMVGGTEEFLGKRKYLHRDEYIYGERELDKRLKTAIMTVDTSGSMGDEELSAILTEIYAIIKQRKIKKSEIVYFDDGIQGIDVVKNPPKFDWTKATGGGGTSFVQPMEYLAKQFKAGKMELAIFCTDGQANLSNFDLNPKFKKKFVWLIIDDPNFKHPFGKIVHITSKQQ